MAYETKNFEGALFKNQDKIAGEEDHKHWPDYKGNCVIDNKPFWVSAWINKSPTTGKVYMSLKFAVKVSNSRSSAPLDDDEIPF